MNFIEWLWPWSTRSSHRSLFSIGLKMFK